MVVKGLLVEFFIKKAQLRKNKRVAKAQVKLQKRLCHLPVAEIESKTLPQA